MNSLLEDWLRQTGETTTLQSEIVENDKSTKRIQGNIETMESELAEVLEKGQRLMRLKAEAERCAAEEAQDQEREFQEAVELRELWIPRFREHTVLSREGLTEANVRRFTSLFDLVSQIDARQILIACAEVVA